MKIHPVGAELTNVDGRTDRHDEGNRCFLRLCENTKLHVSSSAQLPWNVG